MKPLIPPGLLYLDNEMEDYLRSPEWLNRRRGESGRVVCIDAARINRHKQLIQEYYSRQAEEREMQRVQDSFSVCRKIVLFSWGAALVFCVWMAWEMFR